MEPIIIVAIIGAISTITSAFITAKAKDNFYNKTRVKIDPSVDLELLPINKFGIVIVSPAEYEPIETSFSVSGTYKLLPEGYDIWVSTFHISAHNKSKQYWPQEKANITNGKWYSKVNNIVGNPGEQKEFLVLLVGKEGQALFNYYYETGVENKNWPTIKELTSDVLEVAIGKVLIN